MNAWWQRNIGWVLLAISALYIWQALHEQRPKLVIWDWVAAIIWLILAAWHFTQRRR